MIAGKKQLGAAAIGMILVLLPITVRLSADSWKPIAGGLDIARFAVSQEPSAGDSTITIIRIDPTIWDLKLLAISESGHDRGWSAREWCERHDLTAAINAGMFDLDRKTHIGYMRSAGYINSTRVNSYQSAAAFEPKRDTLPAFRLYDLDEMPLDSVIAWYHCVVQNLRLIKRPGANRWSQQDRRWSEAALGEDEDGRALFIFCRAPYSMYDLNKILLSLPIGLVCAQHLEGGPEAQLYLRHGDTVIDLVGDHESGFMQGANRLAWSIPNVIGIARKGDIPVSSGGSE